MTKSDPTKANEEVLECLLKGYTLKGKVIRAAKVVVNKLDQTIINININNVMKGRDIYE